jgi:hypothetical protein
LTSTTTQEQIKALIMAGCAELPTKPRDECMTFMSTHSKNLLDMLLKEYTPLKACAIMKVNNTILNLAKDSVSSNLLTPCGD